MTLRRARPLALGVLAAALTLGCSRAESEPRPRPDPVPSAPPVASGPGARVTAATAPPAPSSAPPSPVATAPAGPLVLMRGVRIVHAGSGDDAAKVVRDERERAKGDGRDLVVYVGAKWCEPCQVFHKAAQRGELDADFPDLTLLEFDLDEDRERLVAAGYVSQFIPLFVMPSADGRGSDQKFEGSVKGNGAVANIAPRLRSLLRK